MVQVCHGPGKLSCLNSKVSCPEKALVFSDGHKGAEGACWKQGGSVLLLTDPEVVGCREGLGKQERASPADQREQSSPCEHT